MKISMTSGDIILNVLICIITGIFSGWITGVIVTKHYRKKDENIETKALSLIEFIEVHQKEGIEIAGAIISPHKTEWYEYKVGKASDYKSIDCWEKHSLFK